MRGSRFDVFVSTKAMDKLRDRQVLMVCGKADTVIPYSNSEVKALDIAPREFLSNNLDT